MSITAGSAKRSGERATQFVRRERPRCRHAGRARETTTGIVAYYGRARAGADRVIDEVEPDELGTAWFGDKVSMRWVLHMVEESARHAGHMDIMRELLDGATGDHRPE